MTYEELKERGKREGFTLPEMLLALAAFGIVAALVIPAAIAKKDRREWISGLDKTYNVLSNGFKNAETVRGNVRKWDESEFLRNFLESFNILKECTENDCVPEEEYLNGEELTLHEGSSSYILADGQVMTVNIT